jgi:prolyl-tRNA synthetase
MPAQLVEKFWSSREETMIKVNQEELKQKIEKLKKKAAETVSKAGDKKSGPDIRKARKQVKRAQRKLRVVKSYKQAGKKATETKAAGEKTPA